MKADPETRHQEIELARALQRLAKTRGGYQAVAELLGISIDQVKKALSPFSESHRPLYTTQIARLAKWYGTSVESLVSGVQNLNPPETEPRAARELATVPDVPHSLFYANEQYKKWNAYRNEITAFYSYLPWCLIPSESLHRRVQWLHVQKGMPGAEWAAAAREYGSCRYNTYNHNMPAETRSHLKPFNAIIPRQVFTRFCRNGSGPFSAIERRRKELEEFQRWLEHIYYCMERLKLNVQLVDIDDEELRFFPDAIVKFQETQVTFDIGQEVYLNRDRDRHRLERLEAAKKTHPEVAKRLVAEEIKNISHGRHWLQRLP